MAGGKSLDALQMRELKYGDRPEAEKDRVAQELRAAGRRPEALLLFEGRGGHPFLREEALWAVEQGDAFHLLSVQRLGREVGLEELRSCARRAEQQGRWMDARLAWLAAGDEDEVRRIAAELPTALRPESPEPESPAP